MQSENPLLELSAEKQQALVDIVDGRVNKRSVLKAGGAAGILALASGSAAGAASTSDGDGDVGEPGDRVDLFADGVDATSVSTESAVIGSGDTINQLEFGSVNLDAGASTNNDFSDVATVTQNITFGTQFGSTPFVVTGLNDFQIGLFSTPNNVTTSDFNMTLMNYENRDPGSVEVFWIAIN